MMMAEAVGEAVRIALLKERVNCGTADDKQSLVAQSLGTDLDPPEPRSVLLWTRSCRMVGSLITLAADGSLSMGVLR